MSQQSNPKSQSVRLGYVIVYVPDVQRAVDFYGHAFGTQPRFVHETGQYAELETGATVLAFADETTTTSTSDVFEPNRASKKAAGAEVAFLVDDVPAAFARALAAGATPVVEPIAKPWGQIISYVRDLNGFLVELCTELGA
jgi:catechol 2,3-dioxygenase-like lactoylglutathione lyase family enzyme